MYQNKGDSPGKTGGLECLVVQNRHLGRFCTELFYFEIKVYIHINFTHLV